MPRPRRRPSRGELIARNSLDRFVGRREQVALFARNLAKDPLSPTDPAAYLFHVRGVGGVGKSTLLRQWREAARQAGAVTAAVDENDVHGVLSAMVAMARQLAERTRPLKAFDRAVEECRREQEAAARPADFDGAADEGPSVTSRAISRAVVGGTTALLPGGGAIAAMVDPDAVAEGMDQAWDRVRGRRARGRDVERDTVSRAFVDVLDELCAEHPWVVLFLDTWEQTGRHLDAWLRALLRDGFGPLPVNVMVVLAGRDDLHRDWSGLMAQGRDVPLEAFTEPETRELLARRGVDEPETVEAVVRLSMGLPLLADILALARPESAAAVDANGDLAEAAVERFVRWIADPLYREVVLTCALAPRLNADVFATVVPDEARGLWEWLCGQPFVSGNGDFKRYHAVVRAGMVRRERTRSPQGWTAVHLRLADAHAAWGADIERNLPDGRHRQDARWLCHRLDEMYHRLCAHPGGALANALEEAVHCAEDGPETLRQWGDAFTQAALDTNDETLGAWTGRLRDATATGEDPVVAALGALLAHSVLTPQAQAQAHVARGRHLEPAGREEEAAAAFDRAVALDPENAGARFHRGRARLRAGRQDEAVDDLTAAVRLDPRDARALAQRGEAHRRARRFDEAVADLTAALALDPRQVRALGSRGQVHRQAGRLDEAVADFTAALAIAPDYAWALGSRGQAHRQAGRYPQAVADLTAALRLRPDYAWALAERGKAHRLAGRPAEAVADLTAALAFVPDYRWALVERGNAHLAAARHEAAEADFTAALDIDPDDLWALVGRGRARTAAHRTAEARRDFDRAAALDPDGAWRHDTVGGAGGPGAPPGAPTA
ncbi:tetratricopeptide repeat protein [Streptomyces sp. MJP52]|uniref:tetratricopeptide repeat protein n=1 Tax=Streptomyces sp. MJP52 TaxID=2940555 RepID=UPI002472FF04|nr:tetratricopeptide repeat protein [Streptomyces sp. MJP52]MDH6223202.1 tetratricopeptide (TPR) repeat protein [Streptomyces sp. MJP52]